VFAGTSSHGSLRDFDQAARVDWIGIGTLLTVSTQRGGVMADDLRPGIRP
jgi:hypothetical protein